MSDWARRWLPAIDRWLKTPAGIVSGLLAVLVIPAIVSTMVDKGGQTMQLAARTDALRVRTSGPLSLEPVLARSVTVLGASAVAVSGEPEKRVLKPEDTCYIVEAPPSAGALPSKPSPAQLTFHFGDGQEIEFLRERESKTPSYYSLRGDPTDPAHPAESHLTITLQAGQQLRLNDAVIYTSLHGGQVAFEGSQGFHVIFSVSQPDISRLAPTAIQGLGFLRSPTGSLSSNATPESGLLSGELAFLQMPGEPVTLRQGANLTFHGLDATLQSLSFAEDTLVANVTGEVDRTSLQVGRSERVVQPTWFDVVLRSRIGRAAIGIVAALVGLLDNIKKLHGHVRKAATRGSDENQAGEKED